VYINWGSSSIGLSTIPFSYDFLNHPFNVSLASNKLLTLNQFRAYGVSCPEFTTDIEEAEYWADSESDVYCRTLLAGKGGEGIIVATNSEELVDAPLYTKRVNVGKEYRVHVFNGEVIDYAKKGRKRDSEERASHLIRNYAKGWVFIRENIQLPESVREESCKAVESLGLLFGAVDVCTRKNQESQAVVFEVNSAPGFSEGSTTVKAYADAIRKYLS
jgi:glutathione synthase/RimK-type ligase-like ATP-grasp enzyme